MVKIQEDWNEIARDSPDSINNLKFEWKYFELAKSVE